MSNAMQLNDSEYFEQRLEDQIKWYSTKSTRCKVWYQSLRFIEIVAAAIIPLLSGMGNNVPYGNWIIGGY
jgi:hypothetical protein